MAWLSNRYSGLVPDKEQQEKWREQFAETDALAGIETTENFERFNQINNLFMRATWDPVVDTEDTQAFYESYRVAPTVRKGQGFSQQDFALRDASWAVSRVISNRAGDRGKREGFEAAIEPDNSLAPEKIAVEDPSAMSHEMKKICKLFGADLVGITDFDERWHYSQRVDTRDHTPTEPDLAPGMTHVIVLGHSMDYELVRTYPSALAGASTGLEYSHETSIVIHIASYIRNLGYEAIASMNDTAMVIPYALKAGLGEYGRNQLVITPEYGPRLRFSKIFTNLPMKIDEPRQLGIKQYCDICTKCAENCPPQALPFDAPKEVTENDGGAISTQRGVKKWSANCEKCFGYWTKLRSDCAICMRVCPFNNEGKWLDKIFTKLATSKWRKLALWLDGKRGVPERLKPNEWWQNFLK